jgi:N6-adenosine-specific RNA methylase IME4
MINNEERLKKHKYHRQFHEFSRLLRKIRQQDARLIDPETAVLIVRTPLMFGPYSPLVGSMTGYNCVAQLHYAHSPNTDTSVWLGDLPEATRDALLKKWGASREICDLPCGYGVILANLPYHWQSYCQWCRTNDVQLTGDSGDLTWEMEKISSWPVDTIAADNCILFVWATGAMLPRAYLALADWGFSYHSNFVCPKPSAETGSWNGNRLEHLLVGVRGDIPAPAQWGSAIEAPIGPDLEIPNRVYELIETHFPNLPKIELSPRQARQGWARWDVMSGRWEQATCLEEKPGERNELDAEKEKAAAVERSRSALGSITLRRLIGPEPSATARPEQAPSTSARANHPGSRKHGRERRPHHWLPKRQPRRQRRNCHRPWSGCAVGASAASSSARMAPRRSSTKGNRSASLTASKAQSGRCFSEPLCDAGAPGHESDLSD